MEEKFESRSSSLSFLEYFNGISLDVVVLPTFSPKIQVGIFPCFSLWLGSSSILTEEKGERKSKRVLCICTAWVASWYWAHFHSRWPQYTALRVPFALKR